MQKSGQTVLIPTLKTTYHLQSPGRVEQAFTGRDKIAP
ncbi:hypothetical protein NOR53_1982 [gamma proteobacterium NOR5-3]|nr:hypothetical protein NOR53_1982 [gamma proteobacterium NOR5-3]